MKAGGIPARLLWLLLPCAACSKYALPIQDSWPNPTPEPLVYVPEAQGPARARLRTYLEKRQRLGDVFAPAGADGTEIRFNQPWIDDVSLRYYTLSFDTRIRQRVEWKAQWLLKSAAATKTELRLKILEIVYIGSPSDTEPGPALDNDWFEAEPDSLRALLELRRYWIENYPASPLPSILTNISVPSLEGPPLSKDQLRRRWKILTRRRAF